MKGLNVFSFFSLLFFVSPFSSSDPARIEAPGADQAPRSLHRRARAPAARFPRTGCSREPRKPAMMVLGQGAGCPRLVRSVYRGGVAVHGDAETVHASAGGGLAGEARRDLLRCHHGGAAVAVGGMDFCDPWSSRGLFKTRPCPAADSAQWAGPGRLRGPPGHGGKPGQGRLRSYGRVRSIGLRTAGIKGLESAKVELRVCPVSLIGRLVGCSASTEFGKKVRRLGAHRAPYRYLPRQPLNRETGRRIVNGGVLHGAELRDHPGTWLDGIADWRGFPGLGCTLEDGLLRWVTERMGMRPFAYDEIDSQFRHRPRGPRKECAVTHPHKMLGPDEGEAATSRRSVMSLDQIRSHFP